MKRFPIFSSGFLSVLLAVALPWQNAAAEGEVVLFPVGGEHVGGFSAYGNTTVEESADKNLLTLENEKPVGFVRWFVKHAPLSLASAASWTGGFVRLELRRLDSGAPVKVSAAWRGTLEPTELSAASDQTATIEEEWTTVEIPVPDVSAMQSDRITGLFLRLDPGGKYEVRKIEILPPTN